MKSESKSQEKQLITATALPGYFSAAYTVPINKWCMQEQTQRSGQQWATKGRLYLPDN